VRTQNLCEQSVRAATVTAQMKRVVLLLAGLAAIAFVASA
jgi:hypothetical protein